MGVVRKTKSLKSILGVFENSEQAFSSIELIEKFKNSMNKTTVYRILERLEDDGILHSFKGEGGLQWYAKCKGCTSEEHSDVHPHFQCRECGKTKCIDADIQIPKVSNHSIEKAEFLLVGTCEGCLN